LYCLGSYNTSSIILEWEEVDPIQCRDDLSLTEFSLIDTPEKGVLTSHLEFDPDSWGDFRKYVKKANISL